nr:ubiquitin carboxyl-terminal hydrolase 40-like [Chrysemys picta bellii]
MNYPWEEYVYIFFCNSDILLTVFSVLLFAGDNWHLRRIDWCYEAGEALSEEGARLKELNVCSGDTLVITEGKLPPKGFLKVPIWWYKPLMHFGQQESMQDQVNCMMGTLRVSPAGGEL